MSNPLHLDVNVIAHSANDATGQSNDSDTQIFGVQSMSQYSKISHFSLLRNSTRMLGNMTRITVRADQITKLSAEYTYIDICRYLPAGKSRLGKHRQKLTERDRLCCQIENLQNILTGLLSIYFVLQYNFGNLTSREIFFSLAEEMDREAIF